MWGSRGGPPESLTGKGEEKSHFHSLLVDFKVRSRGQALLFQLRPQRTVNQVGLRVA